MRNEFSGIIRSVAIVGIMTAALTACETTQQVGQTMGQWTEDASSWASAKISPASAEAGDYKSTGLASWYGEKFQGRKTASGDRFNMNAMTAAHRTLPFGTKVRVTNLANGRSVVVTINDRGPTYKKRVIDLSKRAASRLGFMRKGVARVKIEAVGSSRG